MNSCTDRSTASTASSATWEPVQASSPKCWSSALRWASLDPRRRCFARGNSVNENKKTRRGLVRRRRGAKDNRNDWWPRALRQHHHELSINFSATFFPFFALNNLSSVCWREQVASCKLQNARREKTSWRDGQIMVRSLFRSSRRGQQKKKNEKFSRRLKMRFAQLFVHLTRRDMATR